MAVYKAMESYFVKYDRDIPSVEDLHTHFLSLHVDMDHGHKEFYAALFQTLSEATASEEVVLGLLDALRRKQRLVNLAVAAYESSEGRKSYAEVAAIAKEIVEPSDSLSEGSEEGITFVTDDLDELHERTVKAPGLRWRLKSLNQALGSLRKGDFGFVFARPETGKTTFLASECSYMAGQANGPVVWFNNEEQGEKVMLRCYQAALGATLEQLFSSIKQSKKRYNDITKGQLRIVDSASLSKSEVESIVDRVQPALVVFDQIDKITGFAADRDDLVLGAIYQWARELAKTYCPVIGICQADGTAEGVKYLNMSHVANAKTSKQAEADWILGIGRSNDPGYEEIRFLNISKNKLVGDADSIPEMRHGRWEVLLKPQIGRYEDLIA